MLEVRMNAAVWLDMTAVTVRQKSTSVPQCLATMVLRVSMAPGISVASVTLGSRARCVNWKWMNVPVNHVGTAEHVETSSARSSAFVLLELSAVDARPTQMSAYLCRVTMAERATILSGDSGASAFRVLPAVSVRPMLMNVIHSPAVGLVLWRVCSVTQAWDIHVSAWMAGRDPDAKFVHPVVLTTHAAMVDNVWNCRLRTCVSVHRYADILMYYYGHLCRRSIAMMFVHLSVCLSVCL